MDFEARCRVLERENDDLRFRIAELESAIIADIPMPPAIGLTGSEEMILRVLLAKPCATKEMFLAALYGARIDDAPAPKIVDVYLCKLRRKLERFGLTITTVWGRGYMLSPDERAGVLRVLGEHGADISKIAVPSSGSVAGAAA